ncbi:type I-E CRISPR-associated protein Cas6/Cse3/CasE [Streptomyces sp. ICBB 8177]|uniref:type I-E CRISPR-associated protein Cas6/Cse3/CasE n=1 Tax=Streptomyces sp. ICBB 8177 TaxID=563922 RepID=UPI000D67F791|nr:type I-E CRISPR-associated protein Cas6/Cse3/CasE [Streptomyces sp. ICBB 8177]PWI43201.1 type I-E CRISPR-associated protein Cas6/Cse3/CasE [Streptomyces sp. ICBB 8177]
MYLTRFRFNTARADARRLLSSPQVMHAAVMSSFPNVLPTSSEQPRILWRVDHNSRAEVLLYLVSPERPDLTHLVEQAGWPAAAAVGTPGWQTFTYAPFLGKLEKGNVFNFRLTANPVHHARTRDGQPTKRTAHITAHHQMRWLLERQDTIGIRILAKPEHTRHTEHGDEHQLVVRDHRSLHFGKHGTRGRRVTLTTVTYDGRLEITEPEALRRVLTSGLGKAKAYGCGLMTLAPAKETR